jgi:hypothetical protein
MPATRACHRHFHGQADSTHPTKFANIGTAGAALELADRQDQILIAPQASFSALINQSDHTATSLGCTLLRHLHAGERRHVQQRGAGDLHLPVGPRPLARMLFLRPAAVCRAFFYPGTSGCSMGKSAARSAAVGRNFW